MAGLIAEATLLSCTFLFLYLSVCSCQRDCTGVDCPQLDNCIEEVLESGGCCASCLHKGCTCEGYQYYDCVNAGFKNGKVAEGESYFVDYGSTECSCPAGGGRISCHFISCPDMPPNCIEILEPADGCVQCERVGCVQDEQKYEAGHSFHIDPCRVCHCPNKGGMLMCYPVPDCDPDEPHKPMLAAPTGEDAVSSYPYSFDQQESSDHTTHHLPPFGNLPLFKSLPLDKEEPEDYDYGPTDFPEVYPQSLVFPTLPTSSSSSNKVISVSRGSDRTSARLSFDRQSKLELRERHGVHPADRQEVTESPLRAEQATIGPHVHEDATTSWQPSLSLTTFSDLTTQTDLENPLKSPHGVVFPLNRGLGGEKQPHTSPQSSGTKTHHQNASDSVTPGGSKSQIDVSYPARGTDDPTNQQRASDTVSFPLFMLQSPESPIHPQENGQKELEEDVAPDSEEGMDEEEMLEEEEEEIVTFHGVTTPEGSDVPYKMKSAQQEREQEESESSDPTSSYEKTTPEPSTSSPRRPQEYLTIPTVRYITTPQPPERVKLNESEPGRTPGQRLVNLHSEDQEEVTEREEERKGLVKPDGGPALCGPANTTDPNSDRSRLYHRVVPSEPNIDNLDPRGVQLAALFMSGVDMALFANDACGQPIPWEHCCPWMYFDGKLLQSKLIRANREKAQLIDLCDGQAELVAKVEKMRQSILEGLNFTRPPHPPPFPPLPPPPHGMPFYPLAGSFYPPPHPMMPPQGRLRGMPALEGISSQGGKLEIAGTVVGQWAGTRRCRGRGGFPVQVVSVGGPNRGRPRGVISTPVIRTFGRGGRFQARAFKSQVVFLSKPAHKPAHTSAHDAEEKERKKPKPEETKSSPVPLDDGSTAENGVEEDKELDRLNGDKGDRGALIQPESAFSSDSKTCNNSNAHLNALNVDGGCHRDEGLEAAAVFKQEE